MSRRIIPIQIPTIIPVTIIPITIKRNNRPSRPKQPIQQINNEISEIPDTIERDETIERDVTIETSDTIERDVVIETSDTIERGENFENSAPPNSNKKIYQFFDWDGDGKLEIEDIQKQCGSWLNAASYIYDVSLDNLPMGAIIGLCITIISTILISSGVNGSSDIILKYNENLSSFTNYYYLAMTSFILLHTAIFLHGLSIFILETRREICQIEEAGCYNCCKDKNSKLGKRCRCFQKCAQKSAQTVWGVCGTVLIFMFYFFTIAFFVMSLSGTTASYLLNQNCGLFSDMVVQYKNVSMGYINDAKLHVNSADSTALMIMGKYNNCIDVKTRYVDSSFDKMRSLNNYKFIEGPEEKSLWKPEKPTVSYNPMEKLAEGRNVLSVLNETIYQTEAQIYYYDTQLSTLQNVCYDYASIYKYLYRITIGAGLLLVSQFIMFAVHYKYFSIWNYEVKLIRLNGYRIIDKD